MPRGHVPGDLGPVKLTINTKYHTEGGHLGLFSGPKYPQAPSHSTMPCAHLCSDYCKTRKTNSFRCSLAELIIDSSAHRPSGLQGHQLYNFCIFASKSGTETIYKEIHLGSQFLAHSPCLLGSVHLVSSSWQWEQVGRG